ncbi:AaceriADR353Cp [[Ashbya] aceris (nom. inval.)]|nr:AaceriADR353Cp [[Ashbya] aceris (nom. inval.)]
MEHGRKQRGARSGVGAAAGRFSDCLFECATAPGAAPNTAASVSVPSGRAQRLVEQFLQPAVAERVTAAQGRVALGSSVGSVESAATVGEVLAVDVGAAGRGAAARGVSGAAPPGGRGRAEVVALDAQARAAVARGLLPRAGALAAVEIALSRLGEEAVREAGTVRKLRQEVVEAPADAVQAAEREAFGARLDSAFRPALATLQTLETRLADGRSAAGTLETRLRRLEHAAALEERAADLRRGERLAARIADQRAALCDMAALAAAVLAVWLAARGV